MKITAWQAMLRFYLLMKITAWQAMLRFFSAKKSQHGKPCCFFILS